LVVLFPAFWCLAPSRAAAWLTAVCYFLGSVNFIIFAGAEFFGGTLKTSILMWLGAGLLHALPWGLCWSQNATRRAFMGLVALLIGVVGWANPLCSAGVFFPGFGLWGFAMSALLIFGLMSFRQRSGVVCLVAAGLAMIGANSFTTKAAPAPWFGLCTSVYSNAANIDYLVQFREQNEMLALVKKKGGTVLLPENSSGEWSAPTQDLWQYGLKDEGDGTSVLIGALVIDREDPRFYDNAIIGLTKTEASVVYRQRMPAYVAMWRPWSHGGAVAHWFRNPTFEWQGHRVAALVCHEQFFIWPIAHSFLFKPDLIVATGNVWWGSKTRFPEMQRVIVSSYAALGHLPLVEAYNAKKRLGESLQN
jgi:hypothetical protein